MRLENGREVEDLYPPYNEDTHKAVGLVAPGGAVVYEVVRLSPAEEAAIQQQKLLDIIAAQEQAIQTHLDDKASAKGYGDEKTAPSVSARSYAGFPNDFQAECVAYAQWCAACWVYAYAQLDLILTGQRAMPVSPEAFVDELPVFLWE